MIKRDINIHFISEDSSSVSGSGPTVTTPSPRVNKLSGIKQWTISTYKCSRQSLYERLGKTNKTVDVELDGQIQTLRDTREKYDNILRLSRALTSHFYHVVTTQVDKTHILANICMS